MTTSTTTKCHYYDHHKKDWSLMTSPGINHPETRRSNTTEKDGFTRRRRRLPTTTSSSSSFYYWRIVSLTLLLLLQQPQHQSIAFSPLATASNAVLLPATTTTTTSSWISFATGAVAGAACMYSLLCLTGTNHYNDNNTTTSIQPSNDDRQSPTSNQGAPVSADGNKRSNNNSKTKNNKNKNDQEDNDNDPLRHIARPTLADMMQHNNGQLPIQAIGHVSSIYKLCVGTPRQGLLAPHARGKIHLTSNHKDAAQGLEGYSHIWILFVFHLNTLPKGRRVPMKIAPPALGGKKVGVLATRSPHRPNPVGVTLAKLDRIEVDTRNNNRATLHLSGLDLVDGTPVIDIKPYVPTYDSVEQQQQQDDNNTGSISSSKQVRVPDWVEGGLALRRTVTFQDGALQQLKEIVETNHPNATTASSKATKKKKQQSSYSQSPLQFYGHGEETREQALANIRQCIEEVLAIDVRSQWQTKKTRKGNFKVERAQRIKRMTAVGQQKDEGNSSQQQQQQQRAEATMESSTTSNHDISKSIDSPSLPKEQGQKQQQECTQQLDNLFIRYKVQAGESLERKTSEGSGAEDSIIVTAIEYLGHQQ